MLQRVQRGVGPFLRTNGQPREFIGVAPDRPSLLSVKKTDFRLFVPGL